jgi:hypothetical protein
VPFATTCVQVSPTSVDFAMPPLAVVAITVFPDFANFAKLLTVVVSPNLSVQVTPPSVVFL